LVENLCFCVAHGCFPLTLIVLHRSGCFASDGGQFVKVSTRTA
jgi:hypothetical protein